jgi:CRP/FNR family cyclic AMP-dependent transcriptional regulator
VVWMSRCAARERTNTMPNVLRIEVEDAFEPKAFLGRVSAGKAVERYVKNQKIYSQGDAADEVFFIQKGKVKLTVLSELGKEAVVGILG